MPAEPSLAQVISDADQTAKTSPSGPQATITKVVEAPSGDAHKGIYRISVAVPPMLGVPDGFTFNQFLVVDDKPLLFHTGMKGIYPFVSSALASVLPLSQLAYIGYAHAEGDECGAMNDFLAAAPAAVPVAGRVEVMTYAGDQFATTPLALEDGQVLELGEFRVEYLWAPHTPHGWGTGFLWEATTRSLFVGDLFTQQGAQHAPLQEAGSITNLKLKLWDITDYWVWHSKSAAHLERLAALAPAHLLVMHGSSFTGAGCGGMLRELSALRAGMEPSAAA